MLTSPPPRQARLLQLLFFASGAAGLMFETLWFRLAGLAYGNTIWAGTAVLAAFMGGLALGNLLAARAQWRLQRPLIWYAGAEAIIGVTGAALLWLLPASGHWLAPALGQLTGMAPGHLLRLLTGFMLMLLPATAMGLTLPLVVRALHVDGRYGHVLGRLYGLNTLGAVAGVLTTEFLLLEPLGLTGTGLLACGLNLAAAGLALLLARRWPAPTEQRSQTSYALRIGGRWLLAGFLSGGLLLALEIVWFRLLLLHVRGTATAFAVMLATVLGGIALGGLLAAHWQRQRPAPAWAASAIAMAGALGVSLGYRLLPVNAGPEPWWPSLTLMGLTAVASGLLFTLLATAYAQQLPEPSRATGRLLVANTSGGMLGAGLAGLILLPQLGMEHSLLLGLFGYVVVAALVLHRRHRSVVAVWGLGLALVLALFPHGAMQRHLQAASEPWRQDGSQRVYEREGLNETLQLLERRFLGEPIAHRAVTNGDSMSGTERDSRRYMQMFAWLPMALHPNIESTLLISYGLGSTAMALTGDPDIETIQVVDISAQMLEASRLIQHQPEPLDDPRLTVHIEDGRHFLQTTTQRFDLITGEPPPPRLAGIVNLYTREYFALMRERLADGGMASYWLPVDQLSLTSSTAIMQAFCQVFTDCSLWAGSNYNWILLGSRGATLSADEGRLQRLWQLQGVGPSIAALGLEGPEQLGASFIADAGQMRAWMRQQAPLTDSHPKRLQEHGPSAATLQTYAEWMDAQASAARFAASPFIRQLWPTALMQPTLAAFDLRAILNNEIHAPLLARLHLVDGVLSNTRYRIPVFWLLDSGIREQRVVDHQRRSGLVHPDHAWHLGVRALAERRIDVAADFFTRAVNLGDQRGLPAAIYTLCKSGQIGQAQQLAQRHAGHDGPLPGCW